METENTFKNDIFESARDTLKRCPKKDLFKKMNEMAIKIIKTADLSIKRFDWSTALKRLNGNTVIIEKETYVLSMVSAILFFPIVSP